MEQDKGIKERHGDFYQLKLLLLFLKEAISLYNYGKLFSLTTENKKEGRAFDDIIFGWQTENGQYTYRLLQAKHKKDGILDRDHFFSINPKDNSYSVFKYVASYCAIIQSDNFPQIDDFVLCTNGKFKKADFTEIFDETVKKITGIHAKPVEDDLFTKYYKIDYDVHSKANLISRLENIINLSSLAKVLFNCISKNTALDLKDDVLKTYHIPLFAEVIEEVNGSNSEEAKFKDAFINEDDSLSKSAKELRENMQLIYNQNFVNPEYFDKKLNLSKEFKEKQLEDIMIDPDQIPRLKKRKKINLKKFLIKQEIVLGERFPDNLHEFKEISNTLIDCITNNTEIKLHGVFEKYYRQLIKEVIDIHESKFHNDFKRKMDISATAKRLSSNITEALNKMEKPVPDIADVLRKPIKLNNGFSNVFKLPAETLDKDEIRELTEYFKALSQKTSKSLSIRYQTLQKVAGHIIVYDEKSAYKKRLRFASSFFSYERLRSDLEELKEELKDCIDTLKPPFSFLFENYGTSDNELREDEILTLINEMLPNLVKRGDYLKTEIVDKLMTRVLVKDPDDKDFFKINPDFIKQQQERADLKTLRTKMLKAANFKVNELYDCQINIVCYHTCYERQWLELPSKEKISDTIKEFCNKFF
jgi:hypothetical protein